MRVFGISSIVLLGALSVTSAVRAQAAPEGAKLFASSSDVQALIAKATSERKNGEAMVGETLLALAPYKANLEYRPSVGPAAIHQKEAEIFYIIAGSATMVTGGKLTNETGANTANPSGTGIEAGSSRDVAKGDFIVVPQGTAHWFSAIHETLVLMSLHVPRTEP